MKPTKNKGQIPQNPEEEKQLGVGIRLTANGMLSLTIRQREALNLPRRGWLTADIDANNITIKKVTVCCAVCHRSVSIKDICDYDFRHIHHICNVCASKRKQN